MDPTQDPYEIAEEISRKKYRILAAIRNRGGEAKSSDITSATNIDSSLANYHYQGLMDAGVIERTSKGDTSQGLPREGFSYRLTDRGRDVLSAAQENYDIDGLDEGAVRRRFDRLEGRVGSVEQQVKGQSGGGDVDGDLEAQVAELEERVGTLEENQEALVGDLRKVADFLEETRKEVGLGGFWEDGENE